MLESVLLVFNGPLDSYQYCGAFTNHFDSNDNSQVMRDFTTEYGGLTKGDSIVSISEVENYRINPINSV